MFRKLATELRYSDTFFQRLFLAVASSTYGVAALLEKCDCWTSALFVVAGCGMWWRIFDKKPRIFWGTAVNLFTTSLWVTITYANVMVHSQVVSDNIGEIMVCLTSLFVLTRTDLTIFDKGSA